MIPHQLTVVPPAGTDNTSWMDWANCYGQDQDIFFADRNNNTAVAKEICAACAVRAMCLEYALRFNIRHGIWGGKTARQRQRIREARFRAGKAAASGTIRPVPGAVPCASRDLASSSQPATTRDAHHPT